MPTTEDNDAEDYEWFKVLLQFSGQSSTLRTLEADIIDDDGTDPSQYQWSATAYGDSSPLNMPVEGSSLFLRLGANHPMSLEYYVEGVTAHLGNDYAGNVGSAAHWISVSVQTSTSNPTYPYFATITFPTFEDGMQETTESLKIHVRRAGAPTTAVEIEADIVESNLVPASGVYYAYDTRNQLVHRTVDDDGPSGENDPSDTFYSYHDGQVALQFDRPAAETEAALSQRYFWNPAAVDHLFAAEQVTDPQAAGDVLWPLADHLGTIRDIASHDSTYHWTTIANHRFYDSFGNLQSESNSAIDLLFGFTGRQFDEITGLQYNLNRWYDPTTGRWISEDPIGFDGGDYNLSRYVANNAVSYTDPTGRSFAAPLAVILIGIVWGKVCKEYAVNKAITTYPANDKQQHCMAACVFNKCTALINPQSTASGTLYWEISTAIEQGKLDLKDSIKDIVVGLEGVLKSYNLLSSCKSCCSETVFK